MFSIIQLHFRDKYPQSVEICVSNWHCCNQKSWSIKESLCEQNNFKAVLTSHPWREPIIKFIKICASKQNVSMDNFVYGNVYGKKKDPYWKLTHVLIYEKLNHKGGKCIIYAVVPAHDNITMENVLWIDNKWTKKSG